MAQNELGESIDIHVGGEDLKMVHHQNEIAQSETFHGKGPFSRYWLHNGFVNVESEEAVDNLGDEKGKSDDEEQGIKVEKMSKSLDNFFTIREVLTRYSSEALRLFLLSAQYRAPLTYGLRHLEEAERRVQYLYQTMQRVDEYLARHETREGDGLGKVWSREGTVFKPWDDFEEAMDNDFNTPQGLAAIFEMLKVANLLVDAKEKEAIGLKLKPADRSRLLGEWQKYFANMVAIFGVGEKDPTAFLLEQRTLRCKVLEIEPAEIEKKIQERVAARANKDFETADWIRGELHALGVEVRDTADGVDWAVV